MKKILSFMLAFCLAFTGFISAGTVNAHASVAKPAKVTGVKASAVNYSSIKVTWKSARNASGYEVYRGSTMVKDLKARSFTDTGLKASTSYKYKVRAYKTYKQKQYFNSKTKKWQKKKPKKSQWKGKKTRRVAKKKYGAYSTAVFAKTKAKPAPAPVNYPSLETARKETFEMARKYMERTHADSGYVFDWVMNDQLNAVAQEIAEGLPQTGFANGTEVTEYKKVQKLYPDATIYNWHMKGVTKFDENSLVPIIEKYNDGHEYSILDWYCNGRNITDMGVGYYKGYMAIITIEN